MIRAYIKSIATQFVIAAAAIVTSAQNGTDQVAPNVEILSHKWSKIAILQGPDRRDYDNVFDPSRGSPQKKDAQTSRSTRYAYELRVRNSGEKIIRGIRWDYVFTDPDTREEIGRRRFYSPLNLHPKQTKKLEGITRSAPTAIISAKGLQSERVVIECVILSDGSTWRQASFKDSCATDRK
ncbi:MAG TPA: hypothetical protein VLM38_05665 [Blastocatellia bacterium]|nr:hypothetical protein [Blastocatellia bacterium]